MRNKLFNELNKFYTDHPEMKGVSLSTSEIKKIENELNLKLPKEYVDFIQLYGGSYAGLPIYGLKNAEMLGNETVIDLTKRVKSYLVRLNITNEIFQSIVVSDDGSGNPIFIDKEGIIKIYYIDSDEIEILGNSLFEVIDKNFQAW